MLFLDGYDDERSASGPRGEVRDLARAFQIQRLAALVIREAARGVKLRRALDHVHVHDRQSAWPLPLRESQLVRHRLAPRDRAERAVDDDWNSQKRRPRNREEAEPT